MKKTVTRGIALFLVAIFTVGMIVGCGAPKYDTSTPDGALMTMIESVKTGDLQTLSEFDSWDTGSFQVMELQKLGLPVAQTSLLLQYLFGDMNYTVQSVSNIDDTHANVTITGTTPNLADYLKGVTVQSLASIVTFTLSKEAKNMTADQRKEKTMELLLNAMQDQKANRTMTDVTQTIAMVKTKDTWTIDKNAKGNTAAVAMVLTGSDGSDVISTAANIYDALFKK